MSYPARDGGVGKYGYLIPFTRGGIDMAPKRKNLKRESASLLIPAQNNTIKLTLRPSDR